MPRRLLVIIAVAVFAGGALDARFPAQSPASAALPAPVGTPTENGLAGFAKILCSAVFISGREPAEAARNSAYFFMPRDEQDKLCTKGIPLDLLERTAGAHQQDVVAPRYAENRDQPAKRDEGDGAASAD